MSFTAIVEYWYEPAQNYRMEIFKRPTRLSAGFARPGYMPECARVEDADERVVAAYEVEVGRVVPKPFGVHQ